MSRCGRGPQLEAMVMGELPLARQNELRAHTEVCNLCRHELRWLESERALFSQRAAREEIDQLWHGFEKRTGGSKSRARMARVLMGVAASLLLALSIGARVRPSNGDAHDFTAESAMSFELMSVDALGSACFTPGFGIACGPALPASFVDSSGAP